MSTCESSKSIKKVNKNFNRVDDLHKLILRAFRHYKFKDLYQSIQVKKRQYQWITKSQEENTEKYFTDILMIKEEFYERNKEVCLSLIWNTKSESEIFKKVF